ncbi:Serine/threonine-protein kinase rio2 [Blastocladiella emersonii ATCC 22665]|nr:Serine/threonine-protein kinase rio2 [Blastocladiella emersonii ATCC 22665]
MKLDAKMLRYLSSEEFRVLTAVEMGSKNHEVVPTTLIAQISRLKAGGAYKILGDLAKNNLVARVQNAKYDGYRLTYGGYDYLALNTFAQRGTVYSVGNQIGVGKESDIYIVANEEGEQRVLKMHRLGRTSFRAIKTKRDYLENRRSASWMYMSRLSATKEHAFMVALHEYGFPVPTPHDQNRHCVVMDLVDGIPLTHVSEVADVGKLYSDLMALLLRLASHGLVHGDFNEFNLMIRQADQTPILIDFPQMISTNHVNAREQFDRDVNCIRDYFRRRYDFIADWWPQFDRDVARTVDLDAAIAASGALKLTKKQMRELESFLAEERQRKEVEGSDEEDDDEEEDAAEEEQLADSTSRLSLGANAEPAEPAAAVAESSDSEADSDLAADAPNNREFRAFRDQDLREYYAKQTPESDDDELEADTKTTKAPRMVKATRALTAEEIKARVASTVGQKVAKAAGSKHRNQNKTRSRKDRQTGDAMKYGKMDY